MPEFKFKVQQWQPTKIKEIVADNERPRRKRTGYPIRIFHLNAVASVTLDPNGNSFLC